MGWTAHITVGIPDTGESNNSVFDQLYMQLQTTSQEILFLLRTLLGWQSKLAHKNHGQAAQLHLNIKSSSYPTSPHFQAHYSYRVQNHPFPWIQGKVFLMLLIPYPSHSYANGANRHKLIWRKLRQLENVNKDLNWMRSDTYCEGYLV